MRRAHYARLTPESAGHARRARRTHEGGTGPGKARAALAS